MGLQREASVEVYRCQRAIESGSDKDFWVWRLSNWLNELETAAQIIRNTLAWIDRPDDARPIDYFRFGGKLVTWSTIDHAYTYDFGRERIAVVKEDRGWRWYLETPSMIYSSEYFEKPLPCIQELCAKRKAREV